MSVIQRRRGGSDSLKQKAWRSGSSPSGALERASRAPTFRQRRIVATAAVLASLILVAALVWVMHVALLNTSIMTGWILMSCLVLLMLIGIRRRIPVLPLGAMSVWTQVHLYTGAFSIGVFLLHVPAMLRGNLLVTGYLEGVLSGLFWLVTGSGVYGLIASRRLPLRLTNVGEQVRFDEIPWYRAHLAAAVSHEIQTLEESTSRAVIGEFERQYLNRYLQGRPSLLYLIAPSSVRRRRTLAGLMELTRYLDEEGVRACGRLAALVRRRDDLDYQYALQLRLRVWVMLHSTASVALLVMAVIHGILALRFVES